MAIKPAKPKYNINQPDFVVCDTETRSDTGDTFLVGFAYRSSQGAIEFEYVHTWREALELIEKRRWRRLYAHNGANFDWLALIEYLRDNEPDLYQRMHVIKAGSKAVSIDIRIWDRVQKRWTWLRLRDSYQLLPSSFDDLCQSFNVQHAKLELPEGETHWSWYCKDPEGFLAYLKNDCMGLVEIMEGFWSKLRELIPGFPRLPLTVGATTLLGWRLHLKEEIKTPWAKHTKRLEARAYRGGRTDCLNWGEFEHVNEFDISSQYPSVMAQESFPVSYKGQLCKHWKGQEGVFEVDFEQPQGYPPLLQDRESGEFRYSGTNVFPAPELRELERLGGRVIRVHRGYQYAKMGNPFAEYINKLAKEKTEAGKRGDMAMRQVCKILMNSLYGKFAQKESGKRIEFMDMEEARDRHKQGETIVAVCDDQGTPTGAFEVAEEREVEHAWKGLAAYITSYARVRLHRGMVGAVDNGATLVYSDTDSVYIVGSLPDEMVTSEGTLGYWENKSYSRRMSVYGKKLYIKEFVTGKLDVKMKGISQTGMAEEITLDKFRAIAQGPTLFEYYSPPTAKEVMEGKKACYWRKRGRQVSITAGRPWWQRVEGNFDPSNRRPEVRQHKRGAMVSGSRLPGGA